MSFTFTSAPIHLQTLPHGPLKGPELDLPWSEWVCTYAMLLAGFDHALRFQHVSGGICHTKYVPQVWHE